MFKSEEEEAESEEEERAHQVAEDTEDAQRDGLELLAADFGAADEEYGSGQGEEFTAAHPALHARCRHAFGRRARLQDEGCGHAADGAQRPQYRASTRLFPVEHPGQQQAEGDFHRLDQDNIGDGGAGDGRKHHGRSYRAGSQGQGCLYQPLPARQGAQACLPRRAWRRQARRAPFPGD